MNQKLQQQAVALTEEIMRTYYCKRDIDAVLDQMAPDVSWIGPGEREKIYTLAEMRAYFEKGKDLVPSCEVSDVDLRAVDLGENLCLVTGSMIVRTVPESGLLIEVDQRFSVTYRYIDGKLWVVHLHNSNPYGEMNREEYFPHKMGSQSYRYLQRLLQEKTDVIDMIAGNINSGLKGSNDDSSFSYFYVNEGLPRMLGFTYDEFMHKTGATAVGAVYPPDLPAALADCERCFAQGPVYSTEYRMEKKDGSLIWVLDSGRKVVDSEGVTRINSIVTDITPLKQALFDLEVERERYRIAMENITDAMCEYDIVKDLFTIYRQEADGGKKVKRLEYPRFSRMIREGALVHPDDAAALLDLCMGRSGDPVEFRARFFQTRGAWRFDQLSCTVITDKTGVAVRSIGMIKDITEEKRNKLKLLDQAQRDGLTQLLNQTTAQDMIQTYLAKSRGQKKQDALLLVDLDRFKEVNDTHGHLYGNDVLEKTARILEEVSGIDGIVGRTGGDEFISLIKGASPQRAIELSEQIIHQVGKIGEERAYPISCSVGIACRTRESESFSQFFERADQALYRAKDDGRSCWAMD